MLPILGCGSTSISGCSAQINPWARRWQLWLMAPSITGAGRPVVLWPPPRLWAGLGRHGARQRSGEGCVPHSARTGEDAKGVSWGCAVPQRKGCCCSVAGWVSAWPAWLAGR